jgi:integrase
MSKVFQMSKERASDGRIRWVRSKKPVPGGRWFIDYTDYAGKQIRSATAALTRKDALRILRAKMGEQARVEAAGVSPRTLSMTLEKFLDEAYLPHARVTLRPSTAKTYQAYAPVLKVHSGGMLLAAIARGDVLRLQSLLLRRGETKPKDKLAPGTINRLVSFFRTVLYEAVSREYIDRNPAARLKMLPEENVRYRVISSTEERRLLEKTPSWLGHVIRLALLTGLRQGEILRLRRYDVDRERRLIHVSSETKNHHSGLVPYPEALEPLVEEVIPQKGNSAQFVFSRPDGEAFERCQIVNGFRKAVRAAELYGCTFHEARRTYASRLVNRGVSLPVIAKLLGHGATYVTERYAYVSEGALAAAVARLDASRFPADVVARPASAR